MLLKKEEEEEEEEEETLGGTWTVCIIYNQAEWRRQHTYPQHKELLSIKDLQRDENGRERILHSYYVLLLSVNIIIDPSSSRSRYRHSELPKVGARYQGERC